MDTWGFYNDAKDRGMTNEEATAYISFNYGCSGWYIKNAIR